MDNKLWTVIENNPIIAAVKDMAGLKKCAESDVKVIFILFGDVCNISEIVAEVKKEDNIIMVHMDLLVGLSGKEAAVDFIKTHTKADGIITTKQSLIQRAKEIGLYTVLRYFVIDSMALVNIEKQNVSCGVHPDVIEILPGVMPKVIKKVCKISKVPVIAGGLISDKEDVMSALGSGALSISTSDQAVWFM
ncbi:glycerol uptake operon antiterminator [Lacrimispora xylanisolvens]|uniref:Glycerol uptake operon antiterminator n=1 Tax=Lacrimispora xylanisolvens TaxID=384636 RepID=A0A2S6HVE7_9FIRM|nr:glycerol-3-phosphate responsive antiterminator [Hungatella xylanolytica]PPK81833.1 glycerol uptake operon antiterminator [Hungatella xylanolytica]